MKPTIKCRLGRHDYSVARNVEADGTFCILVTEDGVCKRCGKRTHTQYRRSIYA